MKYIIILSVLLTLSQEIVFSQTGCLPLIQICSLEYQGAFIIPSGTFGESITDYMAGPIAFNPQTNSMFVSGFDVQGGLAEFSIPALVNSTTIADLNTATVLQDFRLILNETPDGNPQNIDRITGMKYDNGKLIVNAIEFYDASADNTHTSLVIEDASDIANSTISGYYELEGAAHTAGWISPVPAIWQPLLGGNWITGNSSRYSINGRLPMGVTAFIFDPEDLKGSPSGIIPTTTLLDYDLTNPLYADYSSYADANFNLIEVNGSTHPGHTFEDADAIVGENDLWTEESFVGYGLIVPGTRTYLTIGASGGHKSGMGYKPTQDNGNLCGGPCPYEASDYYNYYWLWDVNDLLAVKNGLLNPHDVRPYAYGVFEAPFQFDLYNNSPEFHPIVGGTYDPNSGLIYLTIYDGASTGAFDRIPVIAAYKLKSSSLEIQNVQASDSLFTGHDTIYTSGTISITSGNSIIFEGSKSVILNPGFIAEFGCNFTARIGSSCVNYMKIQNIPTSENLFSGIDTILNAGLVPVAVDNSIIFEGTKSAMLNPSFIAESGSHFIAKINTDTETDPPSIMAKRINSSNISETEKIWESQKLPPPAQLIIYPNPFHNQTTISFYLERPIDKVEIGLFDLRGRSIKSWYDGIALPAGQYEIQLSNSTLESGIYFVQLRTENEIQTQKLVLQK